MIKIEDDFLDAQEFKNLQELFLSTQIPWMYGEDLPNSDNFQFVHMLYAYDQPVSNYFQQIHPLLNSLNTASICRVKVNLNPRTSQIVKYGFHVDVPYKSKTSILYLNTNDGYTLFEDGTEIESIENRLVTFDSQIKHSGTSCTNQKVRLVLNINYFEFIPSENDTINDPITT
jgi:hypothetical protein